MKLAFIFPGQGSQYVGMGRELFEKYIVVRNAFHAADAALDMPLTNMMFYGPEEHLRLTFNTQPALLAVSVAAAAVLRQRGVVPEAVAGHSLGEYSALVVAGAMGYEEALISVRARGTYMQEAVPVGEGSMAAVLGMDRKGIVEICQEVEEKTGEAVQAVNFNCPGQVVIAGTKKGVQAAIKALKKGGAKRALELPVSAPFHSTLMKPAAKKLAKLLDVVKFADARVPVYANVNAKPVQEAEAIKKLLVRQAASPVQWEKSVKRMIKEGFDTFVEVGPGTVLSGFMKKINKDVRCYNVEDVAGLESTLNEIGK